MTEVRRTIHISFPDNQLKPFECSICDADIPTDYDSDIEFTSRNGGYWGGDGQTWEAGLCEACFQEVIINPINERRRAKGKPNIEVREFDW